jgi:hypothetical protein
MACFIGTLAAVPGSGTLSRNPDAGEQSNVANGLDAFTWRQFVRALCDPRARGKRCVPLARHGTAQPARARFW